MAPRHAPAPPKGRQSQFIGGRIGANNVKMQPVQRRKRARRRVPAGAAWLIFHPSAFSSPCALVINQSMHDRENATSAKHRLPYGRCGRVPWPGGKIGNRQAGGKPKTRPRDRVRRRGRARRTEEPPDLHSAGHSPRRGAGLNGGGTADQGPAGTHRGWALACGRKPQLSIPRPVSIQ